MNDSPLTYEQILEAAEDVLRRFGPGKATVVDVARALGVSHGSVYRHFPSKAALRDAVMGRWLHRMMPPFVAVTNEDGSATERLKRWLRMLHESKRDRALGDPELFATYMALGNEAREVVREHLNDLAGQVAKIIADGVAQGEFQTGDPAVTGRAVLHAMTRFHSPAYAQEWSDPAIDDAFEAVWSLILCGLSARKD
jgi:AcrR family transcriptional regulator